MCELSFILQDCSITQSTAPGRVTSVAKKTISTPLRVVMLLCWWRRWVGTSSKLPCHLQEAPGTGQGQGRNRSAPRGCVSHIGETLGAAVALGSPTAGADVDTHILKVENSVDSQWFVMYCG